MAFAPQFSRPGASYPAQAALLIATYAAVVAAADGAYALAASSAAHLLESGRATLWSRRLPGIPPAPVAFAGGFVSAMLVPFYWSIGAIWLQRSVVAVAMSTSGTQIRPPKRRWTSAVSGP